MIKFFEHIVSAYVSVERLKIHQCGECSQYFGTNREYYLHKVSHIENEVKKARLSKDIGLISEPIPPTKFQCPDCVYSFVAKSTLDAHSVVHRPFPHICECGIGYLIKKDFVSHRKLVHTSEGKPKNAKVNNSAPEIITDTKIPTIKTDLIFKTPNENQIRHPKQPDIYIEKTNNGKFLCPVCKKEFYSRYAVCTHYRTHTGERPYKCNTCCKYFNQASTLRVHLARHTGKNFECQYCKKKFYSRQTMKRHEPTHYKPFECSCCNKSFSLLSSLRRHKRLHNGEKRFKCPHCPTSFTDSSGLFKHRRRHENKPGYSCKICGKSYYEPSGLRIHMEAHLNKGQKRRPFWCDHCAKCYITKHTLALHIQIAHSKIKNHKCMYCFKLFHHRNSLESHIKSMHSVDYKDYISSKKFECDICSIRYNRKDCLSRHIMFDHTRICCRECSLCFPSESELKNHKLKTPELCEICDKAFSCKFGIKNHMKVHFKKSFQCDYCKKQFKTKPNIRSHIFKIHLGLKFKHCPKTVTY